MSRPGFDVYWLGEVIYADGLRMQQAFVDARRGRRVPDTLLLQEHPHVFTIGRSGSRADILAGPEEVARLGIGTHEVNRGGAVTYHGPGQLVGYPVFQLEGVEKDVRRLMRSFEETQIACLKDFGLVAERKPGCTGVWVSGRKIASLGVHLSRWITSHGFALNVNTELSHFNRIIPCGIRDCETTSIARELGRPVPMTEVVHAMVRHWSAVFERPACSRTVDGESVQVVVRHVLSGEVLLLRRVDERGGFWQIITGMIEPGESPREAAARELHEEAGIPSEPIDLQHRHCFVIDPHLARTSTPGPRILREHAFVADTESREIRISVEEHDRYEWVPPAEAIRRVPFEGNRKAIAMAQSMFAEAGL